jgi:hypothetical protein
LEFSIPLNKFEKHELILKLISEGKTYRDICHIAHVNPRNIKPIAKEYERKKRLQQNKENNQQSTTIKKLSQSSQAFKLFRDGKKPAEVKVLLDIPFKKAMIFWVQFLKSQRMEDCYEFYQVFQNDLPTLLPINNFMKRNNVSGKDIANVLKEANDVTNLNRMYSNLKNEIEKLKQMKNNYSLNQNTNFKPLLPLGLPKYYYGNY